MLQLDNTDQVDQLAISSRLQVVQQRPDETGELF